MVTTHGEELLFSLYQCPWYIFDAKLMKNFVIVQMNMNRPPKLTAGKLAILQLPTFVTVINFWNVI